MEFWKAVIRQQFGAAIAMLENAIQACPDEIWCDRSKKPEWRSNDIVGFWYVAYHMLFWLDFYLSDSVESFGPPAPFSRDDDPAGLLPDNPYSKELILSYLSHCRRKCYDAINELTDEKAEQASGTKPQLSVASLMLYNMRHVQHHAAQLNLILRQKIDSAPEWVSTVKET